MARHSLPHWALIGAVIFFSAFLSSRAAEDEMDGLVRKAWATSPKVKAARYRVEQYLLRHEELEGFGDPSVYAALGRADHSRSVPGSSDYRVLANNAAEIQGGIEMPLQPGAYLALGTAERWFINPADQESYYQTLVGLRVRIPLLRDRGFRQWDLDRARTLAEYHAILAELTQALQDLRLDTEKAYLTLQQAYALAAVAKESTQRSQKLFDDATELVSLRVVPEYQISPALMELELRRADEVLGQRRIEAALVQLQRIVGEDVAPQTVLKPAELVAWATKSELPAEPDFEAVLGTRATYRAILAQRQVALTEAERAEDDLKPDVALHFGATWQGEHEFLPVGNDLVTSERRFGGEVTLVYTRPLGFRAEEAQRARWQARVGELNERLAETADTIRAELRTGDLFFRRAAERLAILVKAQQAAIKTLEAENERFRLGEASSRNVLDAQKDLTSINQSLTQTATELLGALMDYEHASGYGPAK
jgi:outer membrane protein TolC